MRLKREEKLKIVELFDLSSVYLPLFVYIQKMYKNMIQYTFIYA